MILETHWYEIKKNQLIFIREWKVQDPKGVIHLMHGMMEHSGYYDKWAKELIKFGYAVVCHDHPGSGFSILNDCCNDHLPMNGNELLIKVTQEVDEWIREKYNGIQVIRYGHSMGAFVTLVSFLNGIHATGMIMTGISFEDKVTLKVQQIFLKILAFIYSPKRIANLANFITFFPLNNQFKKTRSQYDWISRNRVALEKYINDPLCGNTVSWGYFNTLNELLLEIEDEKKWKSNDQLPPMLILTGEYDVLSRFGKKIKKKLKKYPKRFQNTETVIIPESRHKIEYDQNQMVALLEIKRFLKELNE